MGGLPRRRLRKSPDRSLGGGAVFGCHLRGSLPLEDAEAVFRQCSRVFGKGLLRRVPDGETGFRTAWITNQNRLMRLMPETENEDGEQIQGTFNAVKQSFSLPPIRFKPGVDLANLRIPVGYAEYARESWAVFERLQREGAIPEGARTSEGSFVPLVSGVQCVQK